jgi:hypothetical protein
VGAWGGVPGGAPAGWVGVGGPGHAECGQHRDQRDRGDRQGVVVVADLVEQHGYECQVGQGGEDQCGRQPA